MEKDGTIERIKSCMFMESVCSSVYHLLALNFPEENDLWTRLAIAEESHATAIAKGMDLKGPEELINYTVPGELDSIRKTVDYATETKKLLISNRLTFRDALERIRNLQELKSESYLEDLLEREKEERVKKVFRRLFEIDKDNLDIIRTVATKYEPKKEAEGN
jgi:hypothetical protein